MTVAAAPARIVAIDAVRGFAVIGILVMNIVAMGLPVYAYVDPHHYGGASGADLVAWALAYVFVDGKMRALFTLLFGASIGLIADRAAHPATLHYRRMGWLFVIGMAHAWLIWFGDILVEYAIVGAILFVGIRWRPAALLFAAACCLAIAVADDLLAWLQLSALRDAAAAPGATAEAVRGWARVLAGVSPPPAVLGREIAAYRGGFSEVFAARAPTTILFQTNLLQTALPETLGFAACGLALHRLGFPGAWSVRAYRGLIVAGLAALALTVPIAGRLIAIRFDPATIPLADCLSLLLRPWIALAYAAAIILLVRANRAAGVIGRLAAAGRMSLTNYLASSVIATTIFYGYGLGLYGRIGRASLYWIVLAIAAGILLWSRPWLDRFAFGPVEWAWRALARWSSPPFRKIVIANKS